MKMSKYNNKNKAWNNFKKVITTTITSESGVRKEDIQSKWDGSNWVFDCKFIRYNNLNKYEYHIFNTTKNEWIPRYRLIFNENTDTYYKWDSRSNEWKNYYRYRNSILKWDEAKKKYITSTYTNNFDDQFMTMYKEFYQIKTHTGYDRLLSN